MAIYPSDQLQLNEDDYVNLVKGGNFVIGVQRYWYKVHHKEDAEQYLDRITKASYKNHCKKIINTLVAYIIGVSSEIDDEDLEGAKRLQTRVIVTRILRECLIRGKIYVIGLKDGFIIAPRKDVTFNKLSKTWIIKISDSIKYLYNVAESTMTKNEIGKPDEIERNFNPDLFAFFQVTDSGESVLVDAAQQSLGINSLRSVLDVQAFRTLKYYIYGPAGKNPDQEQGQLSSYINIDSPGGHQVGVLQLDADVIDKISKLVNERTLELATDVGMVEEFSTELKNVPESGTARVLRKSEITATVNAYGATFEDNFNRMQQARFDSYKSGKIVKDGDLTAKEPNFIRIKPRVMKADSHKDEIDELNQIALTARTDLVVKEVQKQVINYLPIDEADKSQLKEDIEENGGLKSFQNSNLVNMADINF